MKTVNNKFLAALRDIAPSGGVLIALSGGADSVCLLHLFLAAKEAGIFPYKIATLHVNHSLRGAESDRDAAFCKELAEKHGLRHFASTADVAALAKEHGKSIEEEARNVRYSIFESILKENEDLSYVVTAHHRGDFCETMLLNLIRGSGMRGLCSIPKRRGAVIRPLLNVSREEILAYNAANGLPFVTDSTNADPAYSRNRIRLKVLPEFSAISAGYAESMVRTAALLDRDAGYLETEAARLYAKVVQNKTLYTKSAQNFHLSMLSRIVKMLYTEYGFLNLAEVHVDAICTQILSGKENFTLALPDSFAVCERGKLRFVHTLPKSEDFCLPIEIGKETLLPNGLKVLLSETPTESGIPLRKDALTGALTVRSRKAGDTITVFGKTHKIKRMIADKKCSAAQKAKLFFLCADGNILYTNLPATADAAFCRRGDGPCIYITIKETL